MYRIHKPEKKQELEWAKTIAYLKGTASLQVKGMFSRVSVPHIW